MENTSFSSTSTPISPHKRSRSASRRGADDVDTKEHSCIVQSSRAGRRVTKVPRYDYSVVDKEEQLMINQAIQNSRQETRRVNLVDDIPEAPVKRPSLEEFMDPIKYILSIKSECEMYGMCKIIPPEGWNPPFCVDFDNPLKFKTKEQKVHKLQEGGGFDDGPMYTMSEYRELAEKVSSEWIQTHGELSMKEIELKYWNMVCDVYYSPLNYSKTINLDCIILWKQYDSSNVFP